MERRKLCNTLNSPGSQFWVRAIEIRRLMPKVPGALRNDCLSLIRTCLCLVGAWQPQFV